MGGMRALVVAACCATWSQAGATQSSEIDEQWATTANGDCRVWNPEPEPRETITWSGDCVDGKAHGHGVLVWRFLFYGGFREDRYEGEVRGGRPHGPGTFHSRRGTRFQGRFVEGVLSGQGTIEWANGSRYEGDFQGGERHGTGRYEWPDGQRYEGGWFSGHRHGAGQCTAPGQSESKPCCYRFDRPVTCPESARSTPGASAAQ